MSDKYFLHDANAQGYYCSNTYRMTRNDTHNTQDQTQTVKEAKAPKVRWWQRLRIRDMEQVHSS